MRHKFVELYYKRNLMGMLNISFVEINILILVDMGNKHHSFILGNRWDRVDKFDRLGYILSHQDIDCTFD
jgi:hypothetical protein